MASWTSDGGVTAYNAATGTLVANKIKLQTPGTVATNAITRIHRPVGNSGYPHRMDAEAPLKITQADWTAARDYNWGTPGFIVYPERGYASASMTVVPASAFAANVTPTPSQINAVSSALRYRATTRVEAYPAASGRDVTFDIVGPTSGVLAPNTRYWMLVYPSVVPDLGKYGTKFDRPLPGVHINTAGRAISFWTNRRGNPPKITSPLTGSSVAAGVSVNLDFTHSDPDQISGGTTPRYTDLAGVQVQYAPRPTAGNNNPTWNDLPFTHDTGNPGGAGWFIDAPAPSGVARTAAMALWTNKTIPLRCGSNSPGPLEGVLPSGEWQIRMRTFDYMHPYPGTHYAVSGVKRGSAVVPVSPANVGDSYASPWSSVVNISVLAQVPPPRAVSPVNSAAVPEGLPVVLTWRYRNTHLPPFPQASRTVEIRAVGDTLWQSVVTGAGAEATATVTDTLWAGTQYEWRVKVTDSDGVESNFSEPARFWVVAAPQSGGVRPVPTETVDGATLGCGTHRVFVFRRGGVERVAELRNISIVEWGRLRDDISDARIVISDWDVDGGALLGRLQTWAYEIVIFRDSGYAVDRVWEGPITLLTYENDKVTIKARDVMVYAYRRILKQAMSDAKHGDTVVSRAARVLQNAFAEDDPNILPYLNPILEGEIANQRRSTPAYSRTAFEEVDDMASNAGLDYTAVGRSILLWGTRHRIGTLPEFRDEDLGASPIVSEYGMSTANRYSVSDGNGVFGVAEAGDLKEHGVDHSYGVVEMLSSSWASDSEEETGTFTQAGIQKVRESFKDYAASSIASRFPPPVVVRVPDNTTINPGAVVSIQHLVPGVAIPLRSNATLREVRATQKLDSLSVREEAGVETITVTMSPFSREDQSIEEGEAE